MMSCSAPLVFFFLSLWFICSCWKENINNQTTPWHFGSFFSQFLKWDNVFVSAKTKQIKFASQKKITWSCPKCNVRLKNFFSLISVCQTDLCQLFFAASFAFILFPGFRGLCKCVSRNVLHFLYFQFQTHYLIFDLAKKHGSHLEFCLGFKLQLPPISTLPLVE